MKVNFLCYQSIQGLANNKHIKVIANSLGYQNYAAIEFGALHSLTKLLLRFCALYVDLCVQGGKVNIRHILLLVIILFISGCTTSGQLYYIDAKGNEKLGCDIEFIGMPSVDKFAVEYALSLCAKSIVKKGGVIQEEHLLMVDTAIPLAPCEKAWTHELAKQQYQAKKLTKKEYGYIVANIDLGLATVNNCT